jgi:hypothetical protein
LPCFVFWLLLMAAIWLYLVGWARIISGTFTPTEIAMTVVVGIASRVGIVRAIAIKSEVRSSAATATTFVVAALAGCRFPDQFVARDCSSLVSPDEAGTRSSEKVTHLRRPLRKRLVKRIFVGAGAVD